MCTRRQGQHVRRVDVMDFFLTRHACKPILSHHMRVGMSRVATRCANNDVSTPDKRIQTKQTHEELERQACPPQMEGQTFPSYLKQNKGTGKGIRSLCSRTAGNLNFRFQHGPFTKRFGPNHESFSRCAFHISMLPTRSHTCLDFRTEQIDSRGDGDSQSPWPTCSENALVKFLSW